MPDDPFDYRVTQSGLVLIGRGGRQVVTVAGARAARLIATLDSAEANGDEDAAQLALAKVTGNYKRGNERR